MIGAYLLSASNCAPWLVNQSVTILLGVVVDDYPCKGSSCGCDSALKCLTACCCQKETPRDIAKKMSSSCCSLQAESSYEAKEIVSKTDVKEDLISRADCSAGKFISINLSASYHVLFGNVNVPLLSSKKVLKWARISAKRESSLSKNIFKIPIYYRS